MLDIDGFRGLNVAHGLAVGDAILRAAGRVITELTRANDFVARSQGDEFVLLMTDTDTSGAKQCIDRILLELEATAAGPISCVSASVGIASWQRPQTPEQLLEVARRGIDRARADGGGRAVVMSHGLDDVSPQDDTRRDAIVGLATTLLERDRYTGDHSEAVVQLTVRVAQALALNPDEVERVETAALLHDIGKVGIPDSILHKDGPLDDDEWVLMKEHPVIGERILRAIPGLGGVARIVRHEHERWDGGGYPDGISGDTHPDRQPDHPRLRRLPRDDERPPVPQGDVARRRSARAAQERRHAVRPAGRRGAARVASTATGTLAAPDADPAAS